MAILLLFVAGKRINLKRALILYALYRTVPFRRFASPVEIAAGPLARARRRAQQSDPAANRFCSPVLDSMLRFVPRTLLALSALLSCAGAFSGPALRPHRAAGVNSVRMDAPAEDGGASYFAQEEPITWGSPEWKWGSPDGEAHVVAARVREDFARPHRRSALVSYAKSGSVDFFDLKMVLALSCQRARNMGYDAPDGRWEKLMEEMAACEYEEENMITQEKLADAVNKLLPAPVEPYPTNPDGIPNPAGILAAALVELEFVKNGL